MEFDIWYPFLLLSINILKSLAGMPWDWDPYQTMSNPNWQKVLLLCILFLVPPCISIKASLTLPRSFHMRWGFGGFNPQRIVEWIASILFPQALFWYAYPIFITISLYSPWFFSVLKSFLRWFHGVLSTIPVFNIIIWPTTSWQNSDPQPEVEAIGWHQQQQEPGLDTGAVDVIEGDDLV